MRLDLDAIEALVEARTRRGDLSTDEWVLNLVALADCVPGLLAEIQRLTNPSPEPLPDIRPGRILRLVAEAYDVPLGHLSASGRGRKLVRARQVAMYLLTRQGLSSVAVGKLLKRDHSTVLHGVRQVEQDVVRLAEAEHIRARG